MVINFLSTPDMHAFAAFSLPWPPLARLERPRMRTGPGPKNKDHESNRSQIIVRTRV